LFVLLNNVPKSRLSDLITWKQEMTALAGIRYGGVGGE
jgi:hypothetical protein